MSAQPAYNDEHIQYEMIDGEMYVMSRPDDNVIPDIMIVCNINIIQREGLYGIPDLVCEVLSPSTALIDRKKKMKLYERHGIKEYWLIMPNERSIEVYLLHDGRYEIDGAYNMEAECVIEKLSDVERERIILEFKTSLFDDLVISVEDVFEGVIDFPW